MKVSSYLINKRKYYIGIIGNKLAYLSLEKPEFLEEEATKLSEKVANQLREYFEGKREKFEIPLLIMGTPFQKAVYQQLLKIPYGQTKTYSEIAQAINNPLAVRAVGNANNRNKIAIVVPCHRVIGKNNTLVGYRGGLKIKAELLNLEQRKDVIFD